MAYKYHLILLGTQPDASPIKDAVSTDQAIEKGKIMAEKIQKRTPVYSGFVIAVELAEEFFGEPSLLDDEK